MMLNLVRVSFIHVLLMTLFLVSPLIDMLNGYLVLSGGLAEGGLFSPSQFIRAVSIILLVIYVIKNQMTLNWVYVVLIGLLLETFYAFSHQSLNGYLVGVVVIYRLLYLMLLITVISQIYVVKPLLLYNFLKFNLLLVAGSVIASGMLGIGFSTYGWGTGTKGFFASGNGLGLYIGVLAFILISLNYYHLQFRLHFIYVLVACIALLLVGSKTAFIFSALLLILYVYTSRYRRLLIPVSLLVLVSGFGEIVSALSSSLDVVVSRFNNSDTVLDFLASGRLNYVEEAFLAFEQSDPSILRYIFGIGAFISYQDVSVNSGFDTLETDFFDIFFMYGLSGVVLFIGFILYGVYNLRKFRYLLLTWVLLFFHSILAGHVMLNAMSLSLVGIIMAIALNINNIINKQGLYDR